MSEIKKGCFLCPRKCGAERKSGQIGICGCGSSLKVARAAPHFWEEPCISGTRGSGTIFFSGCNLKCSFCQNQILSRDCFGYEITEKRLSEIFTELQALGVHNINLVTPTPWTDEIKAALDLAWENGFWLPTVYNCGGYELSETIKSLSGYIGVYLTDFKYCDNKLAEKLSGAYDYPETAKRALYEMVKQRGEAVFDSEGIMTKGVIVRHLVLPDQLENTFSVLEYLKNEYQNSIYISIMNQFTPLGDSNGGLSRSLTEEEYSSVLDFAEKLGIENGFIQEGKTAEESFIPIWDGTGVIK